MVDDSKNLDVLVSLISLDSGEESVDGWHDLRRTSAEEPAQAVLAVPLSFICVLEDGSGAMRFVDSAESKVVTLISIQFATVEAPQVLHEIIYSKRNC